ncbi:MAG: hypothetical protein JNL02_08030, partial [Saprospiraceae bacterium]|nr:hypothetical protein [Saprospiraceae bacterium]
MKRTPVLFRLILVLSLAWDTRVELRANNGADPLKCDSTDTEWNYDSLMVTQSLHTCPTLFILPNPATCGLYDGSIDLVVDPPGTYTFIWNTGATTEDLDGIPAGDYYVTVTDDQGCSETASTTVWNWSSGISISADVTNPTAGQNNGAIDLIVTPPGPALYLWSNGFTTEDISNLGEGTYFVTVTNEYGCTETTSITLVSQCDLTVVYTTNPPPPFCAGQQVTLTLVPSGGTPPYSYLWNNGATTQSITITSQGVISTDGSVTDSDGCLAAVYIHIKSSIWSVYIQSYPATCGQSDGIVDLTVAGSGGAEYIWSNSATTEDLIDVPAGTYSVTITGTDGCTATATSTVNNVNSNLNITGLAMTNTSCGTPNGGVDITVNPGGTYNYLWSNATTDEDLSGVAAGTYSVTVSGGSGCSAVASFVVSNNIQIPSLSISATPASCGGANGAIDLTVNPPDNYSFVWSNSETTEDLANLAPGTYTVTVTGPSGCTAVTSATIANNSSSFALTGAATPNTACTTPNGSINLTVNPGGTYTYQWSNTETTEDLTDLAAGVYSVTVSAG